MRDASAAVMPNPRILLYNTANGEIGYSGATTTTGKTFVIDHPADSNRYLVHGCIEGPEVGVYYRGEAEIDTDTNTTTVTLPDYVNSFAYAFTVQITPIYNGQPQKQQYQVSRVKDGKFTVYGEPGEFFWHVYGKRGDIEVEPLKTAVNVQGEGPYKWISRS